MTAAAYRQRFDLIPHPEGGSYREWHRSKIDVQVGGKIRSALTGIYYLLESGECSAWHQVGSDEIWQHVDGGRLRLTMFDPEERKMHEYTLTCGSDYSGVPTVIVPAGWWQSATCEDSFVLTTCYVGPGFDFNDFRLLRAGEHPELI